MPYITKEERIVLEDVQNIPEPISFGQLNFILTFICDRYLKWIGMSYITLNGVIGVLECVKLEFYRRIATPYENDKRMKNGDVYSKENL